MITYNKFWACLKASQVSTYQLQKKGISPSTIQRLREGRHIDTCTIDKLCEILDCQPGDLLGYEPASK